MRYFLHFIRSWMLFMYVVLKQAYKQSISILRHTHFFTDCLFLTGVRTSGMLFRQNQNEIKTILYDKFRGGTKSDTERNGWISRVKETVEKLCSVQIEWVLFKLSEFMWKTAIVFYVDHLAFSWIDAFFHNVKMPTYNRSLLLMLCCICSHNAALKNAFGLWLLFTERATHIPCRVGEKEMAKEECSAMLNTKKTHWIQHTHNVQLLWP